MTFKARVEIVKQSRHCFSRLGQNCKGVDPWYFKTKSHLIKPDRLSKIDKAFLTSSGANVLRDDVKFINGCARDLSRLSSGTWLFKAQANHLAEDYVF